MYTQHGVNVPWHHYPAHTRYGCSSAAPAELMSFFLAALLPDMSPEHSDACFQGIGEGQAGGLGSIMYQYNKCKQHVLLC